jgi:8-oxo-dGTP pyrophosphatase MutT (NUDIX family)
MSDDVTGPVEDLFAPRKVLRSETIHSGYVWDLVVDTVDLGDAGVVRREYIRHPGAVAVLALDDDDRVLLVRQYRHPVGMELWELPAGMLDIDGEPPHLAARRELAEEADVRAEQWSVLVDWFGSPGGTGEALRVYLARGISPIPEGERFAREAEEIGIVTRWVPLEEARAAILDGRMHNPAAMIGILTACATRGLGWSTLRPVEAPWPHHPAYRSTSPLDV